MNIQKISKEDSKILRWLHKASSKEEDRPALYKTILSETGFSVSVDGFRLHAVNKQIIEDVGVSTIQKIPSDGYLECDNDNSYNYPDVKQIIPKDEPVLEVFVNPKNLIDALSGYDQTVKLTFYPGKYTPMEITGQAKTGENLYSIIMMQNADKIEKDCDWKLEGDQNES